jgi:hypothetical protein
MPRLPLAPTPGAANAVRTPGFDFAPQVLSFETALPTVGLSKLDFRAAPITTPTARFFMDYLAPGNIILAVLWGVFALLMWASGLALWEAALGGALLALLLGIPVGLASGYLVGLFLSVRDELRLLRAQRR